MLNLELLLIGVAFVSTLTSLTTEAIKKLTSGKNRSDNIIAAIVAIILSAITGCYYIILNNLCFDITNILFMVAFSYFSFLSATNGYDKFKQTLEQIIKK